MIDTVSFSTFGAGGTKESARFASNQGQDNGNGHDSPAELALMAKMKRQEADALAFRAAAARGGLNAVA